MTTTDEPRSGSKGILSFAAAGLTLAVGITVWTWNTAVSNTAADPDETSTVATSQLASDQTSRSTATSSSSKATRSTSSPPPEQEAGSNGAPAEPTEKIDALARGRNLAPLGNDPLLPPDTWRGGYQAPSPQQTIVEDAEPTDRSPKNLPNQSQIPGMDLPPLPTEWPSKLPGVPGKPPSKGDPKPSNPSTPKPGVQDGSTTKPGVGEGDPGQQPTPPNQGSSDSGQGGTSAPSTKPNKGTKTDGEEAGKQDSPQPEATPTPEPKPRPGR